MYGEHVRLKYRDIDDLMTYEFVFFDYGDDEESWCIYIISDIDYGTRPSDCHSAHWLKNEDESFRYICWEGEITSFEAGKIYQVTAVEIADEDLSSDPTGNTLVALTVYVTVQDWTVVNTTVAF